MKENIEEDIEILEELQQDLINLVSKKFVIEEDEKRAQITAIEHILSDYKKLQKENEELKKENDKLKVIKYNTNYGTETMNLMLKSELIKIDTNKYMIEIEEGKFVDLKQVYQENEELKRLLNGKLYEDYKYYKNLAKEYQGSCIPKQKIKDKIEELKSELEFETIEREAKLQINLLKSLLEGEN